MAITEKQAESTRGRPFTYRAAVVHSFSEPLTVEDVPAPELKPGQVRVAARIVFAP